MAECLDEQLVQAGMWCIQNGMADPACQENAHMLDWPLCPSVARAPLPECLSAEEVAGINYCHYGAGEEPFYDALCWAAERDPEFWDEYIATKPCVGVDKPHAASRGPAKANMTYVVGGIAVVLGMGAFIFMKKQRS